MSELRDRSKSSYDKSIEITAAELHKLPDELLQSVGYVSFDCFDTILWRKTSKPTDVFFHLQQSPIFKKMGITASSRVKAEAIARKRKYLESQTREVTLHDIYRAFSAALSDSDIELLIEEEIKAEIAFCFSYHHAVSLIHKLIQLGKKIIITSDTYLTSPQLRRLLVAHFTEEIVSQFHHIFVSCEHGYNKVSGLHVVVLKKLNVKPEKIVHIGDNRPADYDAPRQYGISAVHMIQYDSQIVQMTRMRELALKMLMPTVQDSVPLYHPFKVLLSTMVCKQDASAEYLGYASLGPLMYSFANYIQHEYKALAQQTTSIKLLFLLRDAHLPFQACAALNNSPGGVPVRISRFTAYAASFRNRQNILDYVAGVISGERYADICKQLLIDEITANKLISTAKHEQHASQAFIKAILQPNMVTKIIASSRDYCQRLRLYLKNAANVEDGDTLVLIDLGYSGTTQTRLAPVFKAEYGITLVGRYLLALPTPDWQSTRAGLIDLTCCDEKVLHTLVTYVALLEQLCTTTDKSVINFDEAGAPIYGDVSLNDDQYAKLTAIQQACIQFVCDAEILKQQGKLSLELVECQQIAVGEMARLLYLPTRMELDYLKTFKFDLNLGTEDLLDMFDADKGLESLRKRGIFFMEKNAKTMRTNYPAELRYLGLDLLITLLAQHRHGLEFTVSDMSYRQESIELVVIDGAHQSNAVVNAAPTYDGYFTCVIPAGKRGAFIGVLLGKHYRWVQIREIAAIPLIKLHSQTESQHTHVVGENAIFDNMTAHSNGLYECLSIASLLALQPLQMEDYVYRLTFRPISYME